MEMAGVVGTQVLVMFLLMMVGLACSKKGIITEEGGAQINRLLLVVVSPVILINAYNMPYDAAMWSSIKSGVLLAAIAHVVALGLACLFIRGTEERRKIERFGALLSNSGFMGIPLISAVLGAEGVVYASAYIAVFTVVQWSVGVVLLAGKTDFKTMTRKVLLNPGMIGLAAGLCIFLLSIPLPMPVSSAVSYIASLNTPLAMIVLGTYIAKADLGGILRNPSLYRVAFLRLFAVGLVMLPVYRLLGVPEMVSTANFLACCCPVAASTAMFSAMYDMDKGYASGLVTVSTVFSVATIPLMVLVRSVIG